MTGTAYQQREDQTMMDIRPAIFIFALCIARDRGAANDAEAKAYLAKHPELLIEAELTLRRSPGVRRLAMQWRANAEAELREVRAERRRQSR
jgi:hypothetical protein